MPPCIIQIRLWQDCAGSFWSFLPYRCLNFMVLIINYLLFTECVGQLEFKAVCNRFVGFWSKFYRHRNLCRAICHAGNVHFSCLRLPLYSLEFNKVLFFSASIISKLNIINHSNVVVILIFGWWWCCKPSTKTIFTQLLVARRELNLATGQKIKETEKTRDCLYNDYFVTTFGPKTTHLMH